MIYNPAAGGGRSPARVRAVAAALAAAGVAAEEQPTRAAGDATARARAAVASGCTAVFAFGGDGTVREVAAALVGTPAALGVLPGGTTNVVARALGLPQDPVTAAALLARGTARQVDAGRCGDELFLMQASAGLDARIMARAAGSPWKRRFGRLGIAPVALAEWWRSRAPPLELTADGEPLVAAAAIVCNLPLYAGGLRLVPQASWQDGRLDLLLLHGPRRRDALGFAVALLRGRHLARPDVSVRSVSEVVFAAPADAAVQVDGDALPIGPPLVVRLARERLWVLLPPGA